MNTFHLFCITAFALALHSCTTAQSPALQPAMVVVDGKTVQVGCDTSPGIDRNNVAGLPIEVQTQEKLMADLISEMEPAGASKENVSIIQRHQKRWIKAQDRHCTEAVKDEPADQKEAAQLYCRAWAGRCRLAELLADYDRVVPSSK